MGASSSTPVNFSNEEIIREEMLKYASQWKGRGQTELFRTHVPVGIVDFTEKYNLLGLDKVFTNSEKISTKIKWGDFNSLHLFRSSLNEIDIPILSTDEYTVFHALGEPGRDLGKKCASKVSHMMVIRHGSIEDHTGETGKGHPITFNEMLPSVREEVDDLERRIETGKKACENLQKNVPISECGVKVTEKAKKMKIHDTTGIRDFLYEMIIRLTPEFKSKAPGYQLMNGKNEEVSGDHSQVKALIENTFTDPSLETCACIQPPPKNSQMLSHIHLFRIKGLPKEVNENYYDCEVILKIKKELLTNDPQTKVNFTVGVSTGRAVTPEKKTSSPRPATPLRRDADGLGTRNMSRANTPPRNNGGTFAQNMGTTVTSPRNSSSGLSRQSTRAMSPQLSRMTSTASMVH